MSYGVTKQRWVNSLRPINDSVKWRQAIIWTNDGILLIEPLGTNFSETLIAIHTFPFKKIHLKMSSGKWRPSCLGLNVLKLKTESCNNANFVVTGDTGGCRYDNLRCHYWRQIWHYDNSWFPMKESVVCLIRHPQTYIFSQKEMSSPRLTYRHWREVAI